MKKLLIILTLTACGLKPGIDPWGCRGDWICVCPSYGNCDWVFVCNG